MLRVDGVHSGYGDFRVLEGVELDVGGNEIVALIGANGVGKTTLLRSIVGQVAARQGDIEFKGQRISGLPVDRIVEHGIAMVPEGRALFPFMTVLENLELGSYSRRARGRRREMLEFVFDLLPVLRERRTQLAGSLSGGEQQMCAIARGLMAQPELLLLDEPSLGLAPRIVSEVFSLVESLKARGISVLLVEQHVRHALSISDRGFLLDRGRVVMTGTAKELLSDPDVKRTYMGGK